MGQIEGFRLFVMIVDNKSLSKAADTLGIAKSAVSRRLKLLEERYDSLLIDRAPGIWTLTPKGEELYQRVKPLVAEANEVDQDFMSTSSSIMGPLRVSVALHFGVVRLSDFFVDFQKNYPEIIPTFDLDDRLINLETEDYDFAIRITSGLPEEEGVTPLCPVHRKILASPEYLSRHGAPRNPSDLKNHQIINFGSQARVHWRLHCEDNKNPAELKLKPSLSSNSGFVLLPAAIAGLGIANFPDFVYEEALARGELVEVLSEYQCQPLQAYLVRSPKRRMTKRMRVFAEELQKALQSKRGVYPLDIR